MAGAEVREWFSEQAAACESMGSPLTGRILQLLGQGMQAGNPVEDRVLSWTGPQSDALALRLAGGLHALVLKGRDTVLQSFYAYPAQFSDADALAALQSAMAHKSAFLLRWLDSPPQTNEVRRSAVLIAVGHWLTARFGLPLVLSEIGASAGLNLVWDRYALVIRDRYFGNPTSLVRLTPEWEGEAPPLANPQVIERAGVDLNPLHPVADRDRLLAYIWADQVDRLERTDDAMSMAYPDLRIDQGDAIEWLQQRLATQYAGALHLIYHTIVWQYLSQEAQEKGAELLEAMGRQATADAPIAHLSMEADDVQDGAALVLTTWPFGERISLGRVDFHGRWVKWQAPPA